MQNINLIRSGKMNLVRIKNRTKQTVNNSIERHPVPILGIDYKVKIIYKNIKITELDVENKTIKISLPNKYKKANNEKILDMAIDKMYEQIAKVEVERAMEKTRILLGFAPEDYEIKRINKSLANCNVENSFITINPDIVAYDEKTIEYVILHEFCHLKYKIRTKNFWKMIGTYMPNYEQYAVTLGNIAY